MGLIKGRDARKAGRIKAPEKVVEKSPEQQPPAFSFEHLQRSHCISEMPDHSERGLLLEAFRKLGTMTWAQINSCHRHGLGYERMPFEKIHAPRPSCISDDTNLLVFRWKGKLPFVGFREGRVFHVLWVEVNFGDLYDHG